MNLGTGDSIKVYAGYTESDSLLAAYGQGSATADLTSPMNAMFIQLITDDSDHGEGFMAEYTSTYPTFCTNSITNLIDPVGDFSDGSGMYNYNNSTICKWKIAPPFAQDLTLVFSSFDLETDKDFLKVFAVPTNELLANLTGNEIPDPIVSPTGQFLLMFSTNGYNNHQGFEASYYISNVNTTQTDIAQNLSIYPNPANTYTEVKFNLKDETKATISLYNLLGEEVLSQPATIVSGNVSDRLQVGSLQKGIYLLKISSEKGSLARKLVIN